jgi:hypothetical protein
MNSPRTPKARKVLCLDDRVKVIDMSEKRKMSTRCFARCGFSVAETASTSDDAADDVAEEEDDLPLSVVRLAQEVYSCQFNDLADIDSGLSTSDNLTRDWTKPAAALLAEEAATDDDSDDDDEEDVAPSNVANIQAQESLGVLKQYAIASGDSTVLDHVMSIESILTANHIRDTKQKKMTDYLLK